MTRAGRRGGIRPGPDRPSGRYPRARPCRAATDAEQGRTTQGGWQPAARCAGWRGYAPAPVANWWCRRADRGFSVVFAVGVHAGALRHAVLRYKYRREVWWAEVFAGLFAEHLRSHATWFEEFDLLIPMPAYVGPHARRDWDPVGEIVARLDGLVHPLWETVVGAVVKRAETPAMGGRPWAERQRIASGPLASLAGGTRADPGGGRSGPGPRRRADRGWDAAGGGPGAASSGGAGGGRAGAGSTGVA